MTSFGFSFVMLKKSMDSTPNSFAIERTHFDLGKVSLSALVYSPPLSLHSSPSSPLDTIVCVHGFPDCAAGYRQLLSPLSSKTNMRVIAIDQRGYGMTRISGPVDDSSFSLERACDDIIRLIHTLKVKAVFLVGHDWGGSVVWAMAQHYPHFVRGVASFCTPFFPSFPGKNPQTILQQRRGRFEYQLYFQTPSAVDEFNSNISRSIRFMIRSYDEPLPSEAKENFLSPLKFGSMLKSNVDLSPSRLLSGELLKEFEDSYKVTGFLNPMRWYRNVNRNYEWNLSAPSQKILVPSLMVTAGKDPVLTPSMSHHMEKCVSFLKREHIENSGHFILLEHPLVCSEILANFFLSLSSNSKL